jgi:uncharacterized C2H2 Zn-finger protein
MSSEKLDQTNYRFWAMKAQGTLDVAGLWEAIIPGFGPQMAAAESIINRKAISSVYLLVSDYYFDDIIQCTRASDIWRILKTMNTHVNPYHGYLMLKDFTSATMNEDEDIISYISRRNNLFHKAKDAGYIFDERTQVGMAVLGLPKRF